MSVRTTKYVFWLGQRVFLAPVSLPTPPRVDPFKESIMAATFLSLNRVLAAVVTLLALAGCASSPVQTADELAAFELAGLAQDVQPVAALSSSVGTSDYCLMPGDVVDIQLPAVAVDAGDTTATGWRTFTCRLGANGAIRLPTVGNVQVGGKTLQQAEDVIRASFYPKYIHQSPQVVARVTEYCTSTVWITGGVKSPGTYELRADQMCLATVLAKAGGSGPEGIAEARICRSGQPKPIIIKPQDDGSGDTPLKPGDAITVVPAAPRVFTVLGQVENPGMFNYPQGGAYTLADAMATAGGIRNASDARFATVFRKSGSGTAVSRRCKINQSGNSEDSNLVIRPGDVVLVETNITNQIYQSILGILNFGVGAQYSL